MKLTTSAFLLAATTIAVPAVAKESLDLELFHDPKTQRTETPLGLPNLKTKSLVICLNRNTLDFTFATFFNQTNDDIHQFPDLTTDGEYLFLDMSSEASAAASRQALQSACIKNPDLDLKQYAIHHDYSGISGPIHEADVGRSPNPEGSK